MKLHLITLFILSCLLTSNTAYSQSNGDVPNGLFKDKSICYINDSIKGLVMDSHYFVEEITRKFKVENIDSVWIPTRNDISIFEQNLFSKLHNSLVTDNFKSYFRQYFGIYCVGRKMIFAIFKHGSSAEFDEALHIHKSFIQNLMGGGPRYFHVLFEFPDKIDGPYFNPFQ